jgi:hypothetical protein
MLETVSREFDKSGFRMKVTEAINRILGCLLDNETKNCKNCKNIDPCRFVVEAIFAYRCREAAKSPTS